MSFFEQTGKIKVPVNGRVTVFGDARKYVHPLRLLKKYFLGREIRIFPVLEKNLKNEQLSDLNIILTEDPSFIPRQVAEPIEKEDLPEDGFLLVDDFGDKSSTLYILGGGLPGIIHGINELGNYFLIRLPDGTVVLPKIKVCKRPLLPYRLFWTWDHSTNWYLEQVGIQEIGAMNYYSKPKNGFLEDYHRLIDFMSDNKVSGVVIYGFLRDCHGGIESAQKICRYALERGVRVLPGVGINAYGGIYYEGEHKYNLSCWLREHPELRAFRSKPTAFYIPDLPELCFPENKYTDIACPSKLENIKYHEEAIQWLAETFDIGGINFETGDYGVCQCKDCEQRRRENETWSFKDMAFLYPRLSEAAKKSGRDLWLIFEMYWDNILNLDFLQPLQELPDDAIYQFCFNRSYWPKLLKGLSKEYVNKLKQNSILRTHMGSQWNRERYELVADRFAKMMQIAYQSGLKGATIFGEVSAFNVVNEINYLAFSRFGYDPTLSWDNFIDKDLAPILGGKEAARRYLALLESISHSDQEGLSKAVGEANEWLRYSSGESYRRWIWLINRLLQRKVMID